MSISRFFFVIFLFSLLHVSAQSLNSLSVLESSVDETSGLILIDDRIVTHNDSGGGSFLFEIDESNGDIIRQVEVINATNKDWEDIDLDDSHIYIGDFGNNSGSRKDLKIYKISRLDYIDEDNRVTAQVIEFSYEDQTDFTSASMATNFDAEGLIAYGENLYVFTKNWIDNRTNVYKIPKEPGAYIAEKTDSFDSRGLVTGATFSSVSNRIVLIGYAGITPFLIELSNFSDGKFSNGQITRRNLGVPAGFSIQIEAVAFDGEDRLLFSSEDNFSGSAGLMYLALSTLGSDELDRIQTLIYPNPVGSKLWVESRSRIRQVEIFDYSGKLILKKEVDSDSVSLEELPQGNYFIRLYNESGETIKKLIRE